jgi:prephenate dehydrogenase
VVQAARNALGKQMASFVPAHPNTGKEVAGVAHADAQLYRGAKVILTPTEHTLTSHLHKAQALWTALGCDVRVMSPETHDAAFAAVSHLPHLLAFAMMQSVMGQAQADAFLSLAGPGFRDFTRIAAGEPQMWRDILLANKSEVLAQAQHFQQALESFTHVLQTDDGRALQDMITLASAARAQCRFNASAADAAATA